MLCRSPYIKDPTGKVFKSLDRSRYHEGIPFPCGQCLPCRINRRRVWTLRMSLEAQAHPYSSFVTLTYSPDGLYRNEKGFCSLYKRDVQLYLKKLRKAFHPVKIRYFCCGEYGERYKRPHYHLIVFGLSPHLQSHVSAMVNAWSDSDMDAPLGHVEVRECVHETVQYCAGYVTKKIVSKKDTYGRTPEFILTSRRPGIGYTAILELAKILEKPDAKKWFNVLDNGLPNSLRVNGRSLPLGRYCIDKLKELLWIGQTPGLDTYLSDMRDKYFATPDKFDHENAIFGRLAMALMQEDEQKARNMMGRFKIFNRRNKI